MTTLLERPAVRSLPTIRREGITWRTHGEMVYIDITLFNDSWQATSEDTLVIEAAPFGAFVPNLPLTQIAVGSLDPGERRTITAPVSRQLLDRLTQAGLPDSLIKFHEAMQGLVDGEHHTHWIGNLNVYFCSNPEYAVERHCAFHLRVPAGSIIASMFAIKDADECTFEVFCREEGWSGKILSGAPHALLAVTTPNMPNMRSNVNVYVTRTSDGKIVPVEFEFETVDGWGEALGCVQV